MSGKGRDCNGDPLLTREEVAEMKKELKELERKIAIAQEIRQRKQEKERREQGRSKWDSNFAVFFRVHDNRDFFTEARLKEELRIVEEKIAAKLREKRPRERDYE